MINIKNKPFIYTVRCYIAHIFFQIFRLAYNLGSKILPNGATFSFNLSGITSVNLIEKTTTETYKKLL